MYSFKKYQRICPKISFWSKLGQYLKVSNSVFSSEVYASFEIHKRVLFFALAFLFLQKYDFAYRKIKSIKEAGGFL